VEHSFGSPVPGVRSFQDSRLCVSVALLLKVVMPPGAMVPSVSKVCIKNYGASLTKNFKLAHFEMIINMVSCLTYAHCLFLCYTQFAKEDADCDGRNKLISTL